MAAMDKRGISFSKAEITDAMLMAQPEGKLFENALDNVSGGCLMCTFYYRLSGLDDKQAKAYAKKMWH